MAVGVELEESVEVGVGVALSVGVLDGLGVCVLVIVEVGDEEGVGLSV